MSSAAFAHRQRLEQRAEFRSEMHDIRSGIRDLMDDVEGGVLTSEQQQKFDGFVQDIVELRESYDFKGWRSTDANLIGARILHRFGVDPATCGCAETAQPDAAAQTPESGEVAAEGAATSGATPVAEGAVSEPPTSTAVETEASTGETTSTPETAAVVETAAVDPAATSEIEPNEELTAMAERLAGVIADASALMDELLEALGA